MACCWLNVCVEHELWSYAAILLSTVCQHCTAIDFLDSAHNCLSSICNSLHLISEWHEHTHLIEYHMNAHSHVQYIWVDNSDICGSLLKRIFPTVREVLEDSTHLMRRYMRTLVPDHPHNRKSYLLKACT